MLSEVKSMNHLERPVKYIFALTAAVSVAAVVLICVFLFANGVPAMVKIGFLKFITGTEWKPGMNLYGIAPMIAGSICVTLGAVVIGVPVGLFMAVFMSWYCGKRLYKIIKPVVNLMSGIPSVVYGLFGLCVIVPWIRNTFHVNGNSILAASILLGMMILPTIINVSESAIRAVPKHYYLGSSALGETKEKSIFRVVLPAAKSGIIAGIILGVGRAIGETMAVIMVAGNQPVFPSGLLRGTRTMTANIVIDMGYAAGLHREALIATGVVLFVFILVINLIFEILSQKSAA